VEKIQSSPGPWRLRAFERKEKQMDHHEIVLTQAVFDVARQIG
jgi:hypothetical protein